MSSTAGLIRRLRSPRRTEQIQAAAALEELAAEASEEECEELVATGCLPPLLAMIGSSSAAVQTAAVAALAQITTDSETARQASPAAIPALVGLALGSSERAHVPAAVVLGDLAVDSPDNCVAIIAAGGHTALLQLAASGSMSGCHAACRAVGNMACFAHGRAGLLAAGALPAMVGVLQRPGSARLKGGATASAAICAADAIGNLLLSTDSEREPAGEAAEQIISAAAAAEAMAAGAPAALVQHLSGSSDDGLQQSAAEALANLAGSGAVGARTVIVAAGGIAALGELLCSSRSPPTQAAALRALGWLADSGPKRCEALLALPGLLPRLVQLLRDAADERVQGWSATVLARVLTSKEQRAAAVVTAGAVPALAAALGSSGASAHLEQDLCSLACALAAADQCGPMLAAGIDQHLRRLAGSPALRKTATAALHLLDAQASRSAPASEQPQRPRRTCDAPGCSVTEGLRRCGGCGTARYCSRPCSHAHWRAHRAECQRLQAEQAAAAGPPAGGS